MDKNGENVKWTDVFIAMVAVMLGYSGSEFLGSGIGTPSAYIWFTLSLVEFFFLRGIWKDE